MKTKSPIRSFQLLVFVGFIGIMGCALDSTQSTEGNKVYSADQISFVSPPLESSKANMTDEVFWLEFNLQVQPNRKARYNDGMIKYKVPRGAVSEAVNITGRWMGEDAEEPRYGYQFGPAGLEFLQPTELKINVTPLVHYFDLDNLLVLLDNEDGSYDVIPSEILSQGSNHFIRSEIEHFSKYILGSGPPSGDGSN
jgi:hypothetical protein